MVSLKQFQNLKEFNSKPEYLFAHTISTAPKSVAGPNATHYALTPNVNYKIQQKLTASADGKSSTPSELGIVGLRQVPMGDWDWADDIHPDSSVSIEKVEDVLERLTKRTKDYPSENYRVYVTPGGVRAYEVGGMPGSPEISEKLGFFKPTYAGGMGIDPNYRTATLAESGAKNAIDKRVFNARITGKAERIADGNRDFVAYHLTNVGKGDINPRKQSLVTNYHDIPIKKHTAELGVQIDDNVQKILDKHLGNINPDILVPEARKLFYY
jgi:hypothetical protein